MLKFYIVLEDGTRHILEFKSLKEFWKYSQGHYIKEVQTLDIQDGYMFENLAGERVQG
jgi:hypothetical protein